MARERVGVHVEQPAVAADADAGDDRNEPIRGQRVQQPQVGVALRHADAPKIDDAAVDGAVRRRRGGQAAQAVGARQSDRRDSRHIERRDHARVHRAGEYGDHDIQRRLVGRFQSVPRINEHVDAGERPAA